MATCVVVTVIITLSVVLQATSVLLRHTETPAS